jgi:hypothetical protein
VDARHKAGHDEEWEKDSDADGCTRRCGLLPAVFGNTLPKMSEAEQRKNRRSASLILINPETFPCTIAKPYGWRISAAAGCCPTRVDGYSPIRANGYGRNSNMNRRGNRSSVNTAQTSRVCRREIHMAGNGQTMAHARV